MIKIPLCGFAGHKDRGILLAPPPEKGPNEPQNGFTAVRRIPEHAWHKVQATKINISPFLHKVNRIFTKYAGFL